MDCNLTKCACRLVPSTLMPPGHSTLFRIERELQDPSNPYTTQHYGASQLVHCVQLGKVNEVTQEVLKYSFPSFMLEYTLTRATLLGRLCNNAFPYFAEHTQAILPSSMC